jgi:hypothetical protein
MKTNLCVTTISKIVASLMLTCVAHGQGSFQNLNFEATSIAQTHPPSSVSSLDAVPGWTVYFGTIQQTEVGYNLLAIGSTWITLVGTNGLGASSIEGGYSVMMQGGGVWPDASIRQVAVVPPDTQSIRFKAQPGLGALWLSLNEQNISFIEISSGPNHSVFGADISTFASQTAELRFTVAGGSPNNWNLDFILFSTEPIPEPGALGLLALGTLLFVWRTRRKSEP